MTDIERKKRIARRAPLSYIGAPASPLRVKKFLLILAIVAAQLLAGPSARFAVSAERSGSPAVTRDGNDATRLEAQVTAARHRAVQVARSRARTRVQRTTSTSHVAHELTARFASIVAHRPITEGTINIERFRALGLPDTRAP
jgi:hypothetical protein